jgi:small-conductance mechanosensitive channel
MLAVTAGEIINTVMHTVLYGRFKDSKESLNATLPFINNVSRIIIFTGVFLFILSLFKIDITPALASAGVIGVAFAFAAKDFVANLFGGISVFFDRPYVVGDYVIIADKYRGEVIEIGMRSTRIKTRDDVLLTVPNSVMTTNAVVNETGFDPRLRIRIPIQIDYSEDLQRVENVLLDVAYQNGDILNEPKPIVRYREFGESSINLELLVMISKPSEKGRIIHEMLKLVHHRFKSEHIHIPYPQRSIHIS